jgi:hypothetical protein
MKVLFFIVSFLLFTIPAIGQTQTQTVTISLGWTDNQPAGTNAETGFNVYRCVDTVTGVACTNFAKINSVGPNIVNYVESIAGDTGGKVYRYQVKAFNTAGEALPTNTLVLTSPFIAVTVVKPGAATGLLGTVVGVTVP